MLIATPFRDFECGKVPKIVSMVRKSCFLQTNCDLRPRISADLLVKSATEKTWTKRRVQVTAGHLHVYSEPALIVKLPLRHLSLQAGPSAHSLALCRGQNVVLTLQMQNEEIFDQWVKTIAIELIRQTPVDAIKYLDILTLRSTVKEAVKEPAVKEPAVKQATVKESTVKEAVAVKNPEEMTVETLMKKCQNVETYVPVKEKLFLFESLCRKVRSSEDISGKNLLKKPETKRTRSCHDLSRIATDNVREICKYFEKCAANG